LISHQPGYAGRVETAAFGFKWVGIEGSVPDDVSFDMWPEVTVSRSTARPLAADQVSRDHARLIATDGSISLGREPRKALLETAGRLSGDDVLRMHVARMAAVFTAWDGRIGLQAGAVRRGDRVLAVAGPTRAGKSTLLEGFGRDGGLVFCDELVALEGQRVLAGTALLYLRPDAVATLGPPQGLPAAAGPSSAELGGLVHLAWGERVELIELAPADRMTALIEARVAGASRDLPPELIDLAALPAWRLVRPKAWDAQPVAVAMLYDALEMIG